MKLKGSVGFLYPTKSDSKLFICLNFLTSLTLTLLTLSSPVTFANPQGGVVVGNTATISTPAPGVTQIHQTADRSIINWQSYNIGSGERVNYQQPNSSSISLNRINPTNGPSSIYGSITANGQVWLVNPAGIAFGPGSYVNVGGLVATTANIRDQDFLAGQYKFAQSPEWNGSIINSGNIVVAKAGLVALVGNGVVNNGRIEANLGTVVLASGNQFTIDFRGDQLISFGIGPQNTKPTRGVSNTGSIIANGGKVLMTAQSASAVLDNAINMSGVIEAKSVGVRKGEIILMAGENSTVRVSGKIIASGKRYGEKGGTVKIRASKIAITDNAVIDVSGNSGGGKITIGGNAHGAGQELNATYAYIGSDVKLLADAIRKGDGGHVVVWSDEGTQFYGSIFARGGLAGGNGGWVETSGKNYLYAVGKVDASAPLGNPGEWLLDPRDVIIQNLPSSGGTFNGGSPNIFTPVSDDAIADRNTIEASLNGGTSVTITTGATGTQAGNITLADTITKIAGGAATLTLTAAAGTGTIFLNQAITSTTGALTVTLNGLLISLGADITTLGGNINFNNPVSLVANTILNLGTGNANFASTLNGANTLAINSTGTTTFTGTVGATTALTSLTTDAGGVTAINGGSVRTSGTQIYNDAVTLNTASTLSTTGGGDITFNSTLNSASATARTLALNTTGTTTLGGIVGGTFALSTLTTNAGGTTAINGGSVTTSGAGGQVYNDAVTLNADTILNAGAGAINFANTLNSFDTTARSLTLNATGTTTLTGIIGGTNVLSSLTTNAGGVTTINASAITTSGAQTYNDAVTMATIAKVITSTAGAITFGSTLSGAFGLILSGNTGVTFTGAVGTPTSLDVTAPNININANVTTTGAQSYHGAITLGGNSVLTTTNNPIVFDSTIDRDGTARNLTVTAGNAAITFSGNVGAGVNGALGVMAINTTGVATLDGSVAATSLTTNTGGTTAINGGAITTTGNQVFNDAVTLNANTILDAGSGAITFVNTLNSANATARTLALNTTGTTTFSGVVGGTNALSGITTNTGGTTAINGGTMTTNGVGGLVFNDAVTLNAATTLNAGAGAIQFASTLDSLTATARTLALNTTGTITLGGAVGSVFALSTLTTSVGSTAAINGGSIRTAGTQTYNGIVNGLINPINFIVSAALSDVLLPNLANNITQTVTYSTSGAGSFRDITLANNSAAAVVPVLPSGLRNLRLNFGSAGMDLPTLTLTGTLNTSVGGGNMTQSGALVIAGTTTLAATGSNDISLLNAGNNFGSVVVSSGQNASIRDLNTINFGINPSSVTGNLSVIAGTTITDSVSISAGTLTTTSVGGTTLDFGHTISNFNATNTGSGVITLVNTGGNPLTLTGISQTAGGTTVNITNNGMISIPDGVTIGSGTTLALTATDLDLNSTGAIASGTTTTITQALAGGSIGLGDTTGTMSISGAELQRISATALTLTNSTDGAILVDGITAANIAGVTGAITLNATTGTLGTLSFINSPSSFRTLTANSDAGTNVGTDLSTTVGVLSFTVNTGALSVADTATAFSNTTLAVIANDLNLNTTGALTSTTTSSITQNLASGSIGLGNTPGTMSISGNELQRITATGLTLINGSDGAVLVDGITAANTAGVSGAITLNATTGTLGTISFINSPSSFRTLTTTSDAGTNVGTNLSTTVGALSFTVNAGTSSVADAATAFSNTTLAVTANDLNLNTTGALTSTTNSSITQNLASGSISLGNTAGTMSISGDELQRITAPGLTLTNANNGAIIVDGISAANSANVSGAIALTATTGTLGTISFINSPSSFRSLTTTSDAGTTVGTNLSTTVGALNFTVVGGALSVSDGATAFSNTTLAVTANDLNLNSTGALTSTTTTAIAQNLAAGSIGLGNTAGTMTISGNELQRITATGLTLTNVSNGAILVDGITAAETAGVSGAITLNATTGTLGTISFLNNASGFRTLTAISDAGTTVGVDLSTTVGPLIFTVNTGELSVADGATAFSNTTLAVTANDLNLNTTGALTSATTMNIAENIAAGSIGLGNTAGTMTISGNELQRITASTLTLTNANNGEIWVDGITLANSANIAGGIILNAITGTTGGVSFQNNSSTFANALTVTADQTVSVTDGITVATNNALFTITALDLNLNSTGALSSGTGDMVIEANTGTLGIGLASGTMSISNSELQRMTASNLIMRGLANITLTVDGVQLTDTANIINLVTIGSNANNGTVTFTNNGSTFKSLDVLAEDGVVVDASITTTVGDMLLVSNSVGAFGAINLNADLTSAGGLTLTAPGGVQAGVVLGAPVLLTGNGITFNNTLNSSGIMRNLTLNAGTGNILFNNNVGDILRINTLTIVNVNNLTNNGLMQVNSYNQLAGNLTSFGINGIDSISGTIVVANDVIGKINVGALSLNTAAANLTGFVNGLAGQAGANQIVLLNTISAGTHFFDGIDLYSAPVPPSPPVPETNVSGPVISPIIEQGSILSSNTDYNFKPQNNDSIMLGNISVFEAKYDTRIISIESAAACPATKVNWLIINQSCVTY